jgi:quercetin dioxygenase-like cupin family protein
MEATMKRTVLVPTITLVLGIALGTIGSGVLHAQPEPIKRTVLLKSDLEGIEGKEAILFLAELAPGAVGGKHYHSGTELFYALEGAFTHTPEGKPPITLSAGQAGTNPHKSVHVIKNASMTDPARVLGCMIADKGQPMTVPVQ